MLYKFPMPGRHSGVKLYALPNQQLGFEVGRPPAATMAYDSELARGVTVTIGRPDIDKIISDACARVDAEDAMPRTGIRRSMEVANNDDDDTDAAMEKVLEFLENIVSPDDLEIVQALFCGAADVNEAREAQAVARRDDDRRIPRQAADAGRRRSLSEMFPDWKRLAYDDDPTEYSTEAGAEVVAKLMTYLGRYLKQEQLDAVQAILGSGPSPDVNPQRLAGSSRLTAEYPARVAEDRRARRLAADAARRRPMTESTEAAYLRLFPMATRLA